MYVWFVKASEMEIQKMDVKYRICLKEKCERKFLNTAKATEVLDTKMSILFLKSVPKIKSREDYLVPLFHS